MSLEGGGWKAEHFIFDSYEAIFRTLDDVGENALFKIAPKQCYGQLMIFDDG